MQAGSASAFLVRFLDALLPCGCAICRTAVEAGGSPLCQLCASRVVSIPRPLCPRCGLTRVISGPAPENCAECHEWPPVLARAASACLHAGPAAALVRGLKYGGWTGLADFMGGLMVPAARRLAVGADPVLVPVPLTRARRRERGFNQAELLARALSCRTGWPMVSPLRRQRGGPPLARLGRRQRKAAAMGAFAVAPDHADLAVLSSPTLIVDDVITTGATGVACAEALDQAGASCLGIVSFARTSAAVQSA